MSLQRSELQIHFADGCVESAADCAAPALLAEEAGRLQLLGGDLALQHDFGPVGPVDCPIAYDPLRRLAFRYICPSGFRRGDFSQLRAFSIDRGESYVLKELPLNQWALWLLEWIASTEGEAGQLFGLLATDRPMDEHVVIEHRLFAYRLGAENLKLRLLCRDAYKPLAFSRRRHELVFAGADGIYLLSLRGERKLSLPLGCVASGHGASFDPSGAPRVVLGGDGLHLWDLERNSCRRLTRNGRYPVWAADGGGIYYRESGADLFYYDFQEDASIQIARLGKQRHPDFWHARPACLSSCGRFLGFSLSEKVLRGVSRRGNAEARSEKVYAYNHALCCLDLKMNRYWVRPGWANHLRWLA